MTGQQSLTPPVTPLDGWFLDRVVALDAAYPDVARHVLRSSTERRHVIAAYLSMSEPCSYFRSEAEVGWFLVNAGHDCILRAGYGCVTQGFRRALSRPAVAIQPRRYYGYLHSLLTKRDDTSLLRLIHRLASIDLTRLRIARMLPHDLRGERLVSSFESLTQSADLPRVVDLLQVAGVDRIGMVASLTSAVTSRDISKALKRWAFRAPLPAHPVCASNLYRPITTGEQLHRTALRFRNCTRSYIANVLEGQSTFATVHFGKQEAVVHLVQRDGSWHLDRLYGAGSEPVTPQLRSMTEDHLVAHNIRLQRRRRPSGCTTRCVIWSGLDKRCYAH